MEKKLSTERYTHGHHSSVVEQHRQRTAEEAAAFFLPELKNDMKLLDFVCGPGSITVGFSKYLSDGEITGIDIAPEILEQAKELATTSNVSNIKFETGNVYDLNYPDNHFDAAYGHQVLQHLQHPIEALKEIKRIVKPGGIIAVRDADYGTMVHSPLDPVLQHWLEVYHAVASHNGAEADAGRNLYPWLIDSGFRDIKMSSSTWTFYKQRQVLNWGDSWAERSTKSEFAKQAVEYQIATQSELESIANAWRSWARKPNAFFSFIHVEGLAYVSRS